MHTVLLRYHVHSPSTCTETGADSVVLLHSILNPVVAEKVSVDCRVFPSNCSSVQWKDPASPSSCLPRIILIAPSGVFHVSLLPPTVH